MQRSLIIITFDFISDCAMRKKTVYQLTILAMTCLLLFSCRDTNVSGLIAQEHADIDSFEIQGVRYREQARFNEAIECHRKELQIAMHLKDTFAIVRALNNIGTNFRRLGILDEASTYHYHALLLCEQFKDKSSAQARKNRVITLSGIGNIHLTLDNRDTADSIFRVALAEEKKLDSKLGQAMNYANLGYIFEQKGMLDSALVYYQYSMECNRMAKSIVGISLCHNHFGRLFEKEKRWDDALREYRNAYNLMVDKSDIYHWLEACLALARVNLSKKNPSAALVYLERAEKAAKEMHSWEHLSGVYLLNYLYYEQIGDCRRALDSYILNRTYADSIKNSKSQSHILNLRIEYEREKNTRELLSIHEGYRIEQRTKTILLNSTLFFLFIVLVAFGFLWYALRMKSRSQRVMRRMENVRNSFFINITHEFRTPLTVILGLSEQLQKGELTAEENKQGLATIVRQGKSLLELVNQLLDISKIKSELGTPEWRHGDSVTYMRMIMENYRAYSRQKQIDLRFVPAETVIMMDFVPEYFCKITRNLLSNAFKYTSKGGSILVTMKQKDDRLILCVIDSGIGVSEEDIPNIFTPFYQGANSKEGIGTGIGLPLVRQIVESVGGDINVESLPGKKTTFTVSLPLKHGSTVWKRWTTEELPDEKDCMAGCIEMNEPSEVQDTSESTELPLVLIVEDNEDVSYYIGGLLKDKYRLLYARDGEEGLEKTKEFIPDLIITDLMMPEKDGYELCREVRKSDLLNHIPIIIITARNDDSDRIEGLDAGADAYLQKPFNPDELHIRVHHLLEQRRLLREKYSRAMYESKKQAVELSLNDKNFLTRLNDVIYSMLSDHDLSSDIVADRMYMSLSQLNRKVKAITGFSTSGYVLQMRLDKSKRLLASTEMSIGDIAFKCGFPEISYFSRIFKQTFQMTPSQYRKSNKEYLG
ncbi:phospho-acceptor domain-containing protein [Bacteroides zoogleoformans]|nr:phospho-acceptor domain-containing protein [Bacteroides zoogleoformans]